MKEFVIVFVIAMVVSTIWNSLNIGSPSADGTQTQAQATIGSSAPSQEDVQSLRDAATLNTPNSGATGHLPASTAHNPGS